MKKILAATAALLFVVFPAKADEVTEENFNVVNPTIKKLDFNLGVSKPVDDFARQREVINRLRNVTATAKSIDYKEIREALAKERERETETREQAELKESFAKLKALVKEMRERQEAATVAKQPSYTYSYVPYTYSYTPQYTYSQPRYNYYPAQSYSYSYQQAQTCGPTG